MLRGTTKRLIARRYPKNKPGYGPANRKHIAKAIRTQRKKLGHAAVREDRMYGTYGQ